jgi:predicted transcriptional regulator of viral defense system
MTKKTQQEIIAGLVADGRARAWREFGEAGVNPASLSRAVAAGSLFQWQRGVYCSPDIPDGMNYAAAALSNPGGVVCLQSAASIHGISDENPGSLWYAVERSKTHNVPQGATRDPITRLYWTGAAMTVGVDVMTFAGVPVNVTSPARTVVDMVRRDLSAGGGEQSNRALRDFMLHGGDLGDVWAIAKELGCADQFESLLRVAEELRSVMAKPGSM